MVQLNQSCAQGADSVTCSRVLLRMIHHMFRCLLLLTQLQRPYILTRLCRAIGETTYVSGVGGWGGRGESERVNTRTR